MPFEPTAQQALAIRTLDRRLSISAGAGSGKTRVLAERFVTAIDPSAPVAGWEPAGIDQALTVTFTDKAAGEIAERVRRVFLEHGLVSEARRVDEAWISTIHGLCTRLLRTHALEAGLDPDFAVISTVDASVLREEVFEDLLRDEIAAGTVTELQEAFGIGAIEDHVTDVYDRLRAMGATTADVTIEESVEPERMLRTVLASVGDWAARLRGYPAPQKTLLGAIADLTTTGEALAGIAETAILSPQGVAGEVLRLLVGAKPSKAVGGAKDLVLEILEEREQLLDAAVRAVAVPLERELLSLVESFAARYGAAKAERGVLDFEDLQLRAVGLLRDPDGPAARYRDLFRLVMIDEFQDTNEVQARLVDLLADATLCTVGDERQSIYGFRYADVGVYRAHNETMLACGAATAKLAQNFRSHGEVLAFVNGVFTSPTLFGGGFLRLEHGRDESEVPAFPYPAQHRVEAVLVQRGRTGARARAVEAASVACRLRELSDAGVRQGDMVVLLRAMTHADEYAGALRRYGMDYTIVAGGSFFGRPEVEAMRALLRASSNPLDDEAVAHVLASGIGGVSDDGLLRIRQAAERGRLWHAAQRAGLDTQDEASVARARATIEAARSRHGRMPVAEIIHRACEESDYDLYLLSGGPEGRHAYANVLKLARLAEECEAQGPVGVRHFLEHLALKERFRDREAPASVIDERADAVRIMTIHAAKGLEFPVVAVPGLGRDMMCDRGGLVVEKDGVGVRMALSLPAEGGNRDADGRRSRWVTLARERARERDIEEEKRLFYVACTRAREFLLLSGTGDLDKGGGDRPLGWLLGAVRDRGPLPIGISRLAEDEVLGEAPPVVVRPMPSRTPPLDAHGAAPALAAPAAGSSAVLPAVSFSALELYHECPLRYFATSVSRLGESRESASEALRFGDACHAALRLVGPGGASPPPERLAAIARYRGLDVVACDRLRAAVDGFLRSDACRDACALGEPTREVPFSVPLSGATLVGKLDLLVRSGEDALVIDYKTGECAIGDDATAQHRAQADCYGLAALSGGASRADVTFVGIETGVAGQPRQVTFHYAREDAGRLAAELGVRAKALAEGPYESMGRYRPGTCDSCPVPRGICPVRPRAE